MIKLSTKYFNPQSQKPKQTIHRHTQTHTHTQKHFPALTHLYSCNGRFTGSLLCMILMKCRSSALVIKTHNKNEPIQPKYFCFTLCALIPFLSCVVCSHIFCFELRKIQTQRACFPYCNQALFTGESVMIALQRYGKKRNQTLLHARMWSCSLADPSAHTHTNQYTHYTHKQAHTHKHKYAHALTHLCSDNGHFTICV